MSKYNFRNYFTLLKNLNNSTNTLAICNWCIAKNGSLEATKIKAECCTSNCGRLCQNHLSKCTNFLEANSAEEIDRILALPVFENKNKKQDTDDDDNSDIPVPTLKRKKSSKLLKFHNQ
ncbi:15054_t:CDS:2, partial [Dentiscutata heterogama]